jgi:hypothetical protein
MFLVQCHCCTRLSDKGPLFAYLLQDLFQRVLLA